MASPQMTLVCFVVFWIIFKSNLFNMMALLLNLLDTFKALRVIYRNGRQIGARTRRQALIHCLMAWVVMTAAVPIGYIADLTLPWVPFYTSIKHMIIVVYLFWRAKASYLAYKRLVVPCLKPYERHIDLTGLLFHSVGALVFHFLMEMPYTRLRRQVVGLLGLFWEASEGSNRPPPVPILTPDDPASEGVDQNLLATTPSAHEALAQDGRTSTLLIHAEPICVDYSDNSSHNNSTQNPQSAAGVVDERNPSAGETIKKNRPSVTRDRSKANEACESPITTNTLMSKRRDLQIHRRIPQELSNPPVVFNPAPDAVAFDHMSGLISPGLASVDIQGPSSINYANAPTVSTNTTGSDPQGRSSQPEPVTFLADSNASLRFSLGVAPPSSARGTRSQSRRTARITASSPASLDVEDVESTSSGSRKRSRVHARDDVDVPRKKAHASAFTGVTVASRVKKGEAKTTAAKTTARTIHRPVPVSVAGPSVSARPQQSNTAARTVSSASQKIESIPPFSLKPYNEPVTGPRSTIASTTNGTRSTKRAVNGKADDKADSIRGNRVTDDVAQNADNKRTSTPNEMPADDIPQYIKEQERAKVATDDEHKHIKGTAEDIESEEADKMRRNGATDVQDQLGKPPAYGPSRRAKRTRVTDPFLFGTGLATTRKSAEDGVRAGAGSKGPTVGRKTVPTSSHTFLRNTTSNTVKKTPGDSVDAVLATKGPSVTKNSVDSVPKARPLKSGEEGAKRPSSTSNTAKHGTKRLLTNTRTAEGNTTTITAVGTKPPITTKPTEDLATLHTRRVTRDTAESAPKLAPKRSAEDIRPLRTRRVAYEAAASGQKAAGDTIPASTRRRATREASTIETVESSSERASKRMRTKNHA